MLASLWPGLAERSEIASKVCSREAASSLGLGTWTGPAQLAFSLVSLTFNHPHCRFVQIPTVSLCSKVSTSVARSQLCNFPGADLGSWESAIEALHTLLQLLSLIAKVGTLATRRVVGAVADCR